MQRWILLVTGVLLAGCSGKSPVAKEANNTSNLVAVVDQANATASAARAEAGKPPPTGAAPEALSPAGAPPRNQAASVSAPADPATAIPAALAGRWGLTPQDCTAPPAKARGLLLIDGGQLLFYDSRAVPSGDVLTDAGATRGTFDFSGEGRTWTKFESLKLSGDKLTRTEGNPTASYTYAKC